ncbi:MAG: prepilin-type N-terminal cleavage/methylation domain-containing protein [Opitutaceae bacterium]|jgi:prepilin-type N-terminal cleavage/methylation domain-containing protein/prepilin-type processing-associated H-X9-DG protein|nr:prepilin-type N-terminal cleavage/methylation domain-containing protein [Opitutaceae bacterium]
MKTNPAPRHPNFQRFSFQFSAFPKSAFTLIELLTVIAIIGILAAITLVGIQSARRKANAITCSSNLRQVGLDIILYAENNRDKLPPKQADVPAEDQSWMGTVSMAVHGDRVKRPYQGCNATRRELNLRLQDWTYSYNESAIRNMEYRTGRPLTRSQLEAPSKTMAASDAAIVNNRYNYICLVGGNQSPYPIHDGRANIVFHDGHVESRLSADIPPQADPRGSIGWYFWYGVLF